MTAVRVAPAAVEPDQLERELKFVLPAAQGLLARSLLQSVCRPDVEYPAATLSTIYFDTPDLRFLGEKIDSDYLKTKVRLRWYAPVGGHDDLARAFLEIKMRIGDRRRKVRVQTPLTAATLTDLSLDRPELEEVMALARPLGIPLPARLLPVVLLRYDRYRFVEPMSSSRISIDLNISAPRGSHRLVRDAAPVTLPHAVLEVKGAGTDLPRVLHPLIRAGARRGSSSKYAAAAFVMLNYV
jgi:VTC domain-containing protein